MRALLLLALAAAPAAGARRPDPKEVLRRSLEPTAAAYEGTLRVERGGSSRRVNVRWQKPGLYRREVLDAAGAPAQVVYSDGHVERVYDRARRRVWEGDPPDPEIRRLAPDDELDLLAANYDVSLSTSEPVAGRPCWRLDLRSKDGGRLQRRLWVDRRTGLVLGTADYRPEGGQAWSARFESLTLPGRRPKSAFAFAPPEGTAVLQRGGDDYLGLEQAKAASGLEPRVPARLPSGYVFESLDVLPRKGGKILHLRYSDGVNALSLFQCPPGVKLAFAEGPAWTKDGRALGWKKDGARFVLVGRLSAEELARVAESVR